MNILQMIEEWEKGCSCTVGKDPINCSACTDALICAIKESVKPQPLTKVEYVKHEKGTKLSVLVSLWEDGKLYTKSMESYKVVLDIDRVIRICRDGGAYERIETEINERDEFIDKCVVTATGNGLGDDREWMGQLYDAGCRFVDKDGE